jgi:hypothetical protein
MSYGNDALMGALSKILESEASEETREIKNTILRRIAEESEVKPSRIPAPLNITEVGGYINLLEQIDAPTPELKAMKARMQMSIIASALWLPV